MENDEFDFRVMQFLKASYARILLLVIKSPFKKLKLFMDPDKVKH
jgi:hypothetical protein